MRTFVSRCFPFHLGVAQVSTLTLLVPSATHSMGIKLDLLSFCWLSLELFPNIKQKGGYKLSHTYHIILSCIIFILLGKDLKVEWLGLCGMYMLNCVRSYLIFSGDWPHHSHSFWTHVYGCSDFMFSAVLIFVPEMTNSSSKGLVPSEFMPACVFFLILLSYLSFCYYLKVEITKCGSLPFFFNT